MVEMANIQGLPPLPKCFSGLIGSDSAQWKEMERIHTMRTNIMNGLSKDQAGSCGTSGSETPETGENSSENESDSSSGMFNPFVKLNTALTKLRREMVGLRQLDMSLLCQLWSLHEAVQNYKCAVHDRYSETNSEYSFGMNSRTSSMNSIDDYDLNTDIHLPQENSLIESLHGSTSSLLQQIIDLRERAETEF